RRSRLRRSQLHTKPRALSSALNEAAHCASGPNTETKTLACLRSGLVSTSVTVTKPSRGSLSCRCTSMEISSLMSWLTRTSRLPCIGSENLDLNIGDPAVHVVLDVVHGLGDDLVGVARIAGDAGQGKGRTLPHVVVIHLGDRDLEAAPQGILQAFQYV